MPEHVVQSFLDFATETAKAAGRFFGSLDRRLRRRIPKMNTAESTKLTASSDHCGGRAYPLHEHTADARSRESARPSG